MIRYFSIVLIGLFFLQNGFNTLVYTQFRIQQNYIAKELCVYKRMAVNVCKGNCYLKKRLQKEDADSGDSISYLKEKVKLYFDPYCFPISDFYYTWEKTHAAVFCRLRSQAGNDVFHPPA